MKSILALSAAMLLLCTYSADAQWHGPQVPDSLSFQGRLTDLAGDPVTDGDYEIRFRMYKGATQVWEQTSFDVPVRSGVFNATLTGNVTWPLDTVAFNEPIDLGVKVVGDPEMAPRTPLTSAAYALGMRGLSAVHAKDGQKEAPNLIGGASNNVVVDGVVGATISGGGGRSGVVTVVPDSVLGHWGTVSGGRQNTAGDEGASVGGGQENKARGRWAEIGGGYKNKALGETATVGGGNRNTAGMTGASNQTVSGGESNTASSSNSTVGGGWTNTAGGSYSTVTGGYNNQALGFAASLNGGRWNWARGKYSTVGGGYSNQANRGYSFVAGQGARAEHSGSFVWADSAADESVVAFSTTATNQFLIRASGGVGIGTNAPARLLHLSGDNAVVRIDRDQGVGGPSILLNQYAPAEPETPWNSFVMVASATSSGVGTYEIRDLGAAVGGVGALRMRIDDAGFFGLNTGSSAYPLQVGTAGNMSTGNGAHVTTGGVWTAGSSRSFKTNFVEIDNREILGRLVALPVTRWEYKDSDEGQHMGPVAEDFYDAFGLGNDDRYIGTTDASAVSMAAIKGLYELVREQQATISSQNERIAALEARLD